MFFSNPIFDIILYLSFSYCVANSKWVCTFLCFPLTHLSTIVLTLCCFVFCFYFITLGAGKVNRRRNESSFPPLESRKAEMTSAAVSSSSSSGSRGNQNKLATNPNLQLLASVSGSRPHTDSSSIDGGGGGSRSNNSETLVRASVVVETPSRVEAASNALSASYKVSCPLPPTASSPSTTASSSSSSSCSAKKVTSGGARDHSNLNSGSDPTTSSVLASALPPLPSAISSFHSASRITTDNPDLKIQPQGSRGASANANHGRNPPPAAELAVKDSAVALTLTQLVAGAGTVDTVDSSLVCTTDSYSRSDVVFDCLPTTASDKATHHHKNQLVAGTEAIAALCVSHEQGEKKEQVTRGSSVMGTYPPILHSAFTQGRKSVSAVDLVQQSSIKEDDLLDDFFQFVSNGKATFA